VIRCLTTAGCLHGDRISPTCSIKKAQLHLDDCEQIVEIVRNPAGKLADRFHFLRLSKLLSNCRR